MPTGLDFRRISRDVTMVESHSVSVPLSWMDLTRKATTPPCKTNRVNKPSNSTSMLRDYGECSAPRGIHLSIRCRSSFPLKKDVCSPSAWKPVVSRNVSREFDPQTSAALGNREGPAKSPPLDCANIPVASAALRAKTTKSFQFRRITLSARLVPQSLPISCDPLLMPLPCRLHRLRWAHSQSGCD